MFFVCQRYDFLLLAPKKFCSLRKTRFAHYHKLCTFACYLSFPTGSDGLFYGITGRLNFRPRYPVPRTYPEREHSQRPLLGWDKQCSTTGVGNGIWNNPGKNARTGRLWTSWNVNDFYCYRNHNH